MKKKKKFLQVLSEIIMLVIAVCAFRTPLFAQNREALPEETQSGENAAGIVGEEMTDAESPDQSVAAEDFRFWTVAKRPAFALEDIVFLEEKEESARIVGSLKKDGVLYVLEDINDGWLYAESGDVRGFVYAETLLRGEDAEVRFDALIRETAEKHPEVHREDLYLYLDMPAAAPEAPRSENGALTHVRATVHCAVADKVYAFPQSDSTNIYEEKDENSRLVGILPEGGVCFILEGMIRAGGLDDEAAADAQTRVKLQQLELLEKLQIRYEEIIGRLQSEGASRAAEMLALRSEQLETEQDVIRDEADRIAGFEDWVFVESGDVRGFVKSSDLTIDHVLPDGSSGENETEYQTASAFIPPADNAALYQTLTSIRSGIPGDSFREAVVDYATQYIGNPYAWGGTDPDAGADCSGFVQAIYGHFGILLPHSAEQQAMVGKRLDLADAQPGDLIFYQDNSGMIYHVAICIGGGETVEAGNSSNGIVRGRVGAEACWAVCVMEDEAFTPVVETYEGYPVGTNNCYSAAYNYGTRKWAQPGSSIHSAWEQAGSVYTDNAATIDGYYLIACTQLYGSAGDAITWYFDDGSTLETIIADIKKTSDRNYTPWGSVIGGEVINVLEFETDQQIQPGTEGCIPQIAGKRVTGWINNGISVACLTGGAG